MRKQSTHAENKVFPYAEMEELESELFTKVRKQAGNHLRYPNTGKQGITLGGILLFGKEELIHAALSHQKTDAIIRRENLDRYDD